MINFSDCPVCQSEHSCSQFFLALPQSMRSDGVVLNEPLRKYFCNVCGLGIGANRQPDDAYLRSDGLSIYERNRNRAIANGIASIVSEYNYSINGRLLEIGAASFQTSVGLAELLSGWCVVGIDPSPEAHVGTEINVVTIVGDYLSNRFDVGFDVIFSNNVIEHIPNLVAFFEKMSRELTEQGIIIACTPSFTETNHELLFTDHLWHFTPESVEKLSSNAQLELLDHFVSEWDSGTHVYVLRKCTSPRLDIDSQSSLTANDLNERRLRYLSWWLTSHQVVKTQVATDRPLVMFGAGEFAQLVRAYWPDVYHAVTGIIVDSSRGTRDFGDLPIFELKDFHQREVQVLLAVHPRNISAVMTNLVSKGFAGDHLMLVGPQRL